MSAKVMRIADSHPGTCTKRITLVMGIALATLAILPAGAVAFPPDYGPNNDNPASPPPHALADDQQANKAATSVDENGQPTFDRTEREPEPMKAVHIDEKLGDKLPMDLTFTDANRQTVRLGDVISKDRPTILNLGYYRCPMLCDLVIDGVANAAADIPLTIGRDYRIVTVSIDPSDTPPAARLKQTQSIEKFNGPVPSDGWRFFVGRQDDIATLADAVGFGYEYLPESNEFAHPAVIVIITPDGRISRYLRGVRFDSKTLRLSLVEASDGQIGSTIDQLLLTCFHFDPQAGTYNVTAMAIMRGGGLITIIVLAGAIGVWLLREHRRKKSTESLTTAVTS